MVESAHDDTRFSPAVDARFSYRGEDVVQTLERICKIVGYPKSIRVDQGSEFISRDLDLWAYQRGVILDFSRPGKPTDNSFIESFNGKLRAVCLNTHWFMSLDDARVKLEDFDPAIIACVRHSRRFRRLDLYSVRKIPSHDPDSWEAQCTLVGQYQTTTQRGFRYLYAR